MTPEIISEIEKLIEAKNSGQHTDQIAQNLDLDPVQLAGFYRTLKVLGVDIKRSPMRLSPQTREERRAHMTALWAGAKKNGKGHAIAS